MADHHATEEILPPKPPQVDHRKYQVDSDADSEDPDAYVRETAPVGPLTAVHQHRQAEADNGAKPVHDEDPQDEKALNADAEPASVAGHAEASAQREEAPPIVPVISADAKLHTGDTDSDGDDDDDDGAAEETEGAEDEEVGVEGATEAPATAVAPRKDPAAEEHTDAAEAAPITSDADAPAVEAVKDAKDATPPVPGQTGEEVPAPAPTAPPTLAEKKKTKKNVTTQTVEKLKGDRAAPVKMEKSASAAAAAAAPDAPPPRQKTKGAANKTAPAPANNTTSPAKKATNQQAKPRKASDAAAEKKAKDGTPATVDDPRAAAARHSHQRKRTAKEAALVATFSSHPGSSTDAAEGTAGGSVMNRFDGAVGTQNIPVVIRRSRGGAGGLYAFHSGPLATTTTTSDPAFRGARATPQASHHNGNHSHNPHGATDRVASVSPQRHEPPQHRVAATGSERRSRGRHSASAATPQASAPLSHKGGSPSAAESAAAPTPMRAFLATLEDSIVVRSGGSSVRFVEANHLPPLPPSLVAAVVAFYESHLLKLPETEEARIVACMCPKESDRRVVRRYLREKQRILQRHTQQPPPQGNGIAAVDSCRRRTFAASAVDASKRGGGGGIGRGESVPPASVFADPAAVAALRVFDSDPAILAFKANFTQQSCAAFVHVNVEACVARRQRYYDHQPALAWAKHVVVDEATLTPLYTQSVHTVLYQTLGLTEEESAQRRFTEPLVKAVLRCMPPMVLPPATTDAAHDDHSVAAAEEADEAEEEAAEDVNGSRAAPAMETDAPHHNDDVAGEEGAEESNHGGNADDAVNEDVAYVPYNGDNAADEPGLEHDQPVDEVEELAEAEWQDGNDVAAAHNAQ